MIKVKQWYEKVIYDNYNLVFSHDSHHNENKIENIYLSIHKYLDHGEASATNMIRYMGDAWGRSSAGSGGNTVGNDIYRETSGNRGTVGGFTTNI